MNTKLLTTKEVSEILGLSRVSIFKKIKSGEIKAEKFGRNFLIKESDIPNILTKKISDKEKRDVETSVSKATKEYGEAFRLLGKE